MASCAGIQSVPPSTPPQAPPSQTKDGAISPEEPSPRALASLRLTEQGRRLLDSGDPDAAISALERAVGLNPTNGQNYYYLSEAWLAKGDTTEAEKFNRLAGLYLEGEEWHVKLLDQRERIRKRGR
jgi:tetratricopeptide (TPR) repeat protein